MGDGGNDALMAVPVERRYLVDSCPETGLQRVTDNGGVPCGWDGLNDPCELPGHGHCDEECVGTGMGCTAFDCDFYAEAITTGKIHDATTGLLSVAWCFFKTLC